MAVVAERAGWSTTRRFYAGLTLAIFAAVLLGFSRTFGSISLVEAAVVRWPFAMIAAASPVPFFSTTDLLLDLFLVPLVVWDLASRGRLHPVTLRRPRADRFRAAQARAVANGRLARLCRLGDAIVGLIRAGRLIP